MRRHPVGKQKVNLQTVQNQYRGARLPLHVLITSLWWHSELLFSRHHPAITSKHRILYKVHSDEQHGEAAVQPLPYRATVGELTTISVPLVM